MARGRYSALARPASRYVPAFIYNLRALGWVLCLAVLQQRPPRRAHASDNSSDGLLLPFQPSAA